MKHRRLKHNSNNGRERTASGGIVPIMSTNGGIFGSKTYGGESNSSVFRPFAEAEALCGNIRGYLTSGLFSQRSHSTGTI